MIKENENLIKMRKSQIENTKKLCVAECNKRVALNNAKNANEQIHLLNLQRAWSRVPAYETAVKRAKEDLNLKTKKLDELVKKWNNYRSKTPFLGLPRVLYKIWPPK